jgi:uncharacterized membrane protein HdeD (DUF308 family)
VSGTDLPTGKAVFGAAPRVLAAAGSGIAAIVIIAGALWSVYRMARRRQPALRGVRRMTSPRQLVIGNLLIAVGTIVLSASGTLAGRLGKDTAFSLTLLIGIAILFAGFLVASTTPRQPLRALRQRAA